MVYLKFADVTQIRSVFLGGFNLLKSQRNIRFENFWLHANDRYQWVLTYKINWNAYFASQKVYKVKNGNLTFWLLLMSMFRLWYWNWLSLKCHFQTRPTRGSDDVWQNCHARRTSQTAKRRLNAKTERKIFLKIVPDIQMVDNYLSFVDWYFFLVRACQTSSDPGARARRLTNSRCWIVCKERSYVIPIHNFTVKVRTYGLVRTSVLFAQFVL